MIHDYSTKWRVFIGIALLSFGCYLDYTVVNIALPTIQKELHANLTQLQWVMNIYFLALCILATIMGRCGDLYGRRRMFYLGVNIFAVASLIAGCSSNMTGLIFGRALQGIGAAIVFPLGPSLLPEAFPEKERGKAIAWFGSLGGVALALGPVLGGFIVSHWSWRGIFFINIPIILLGYFFALRHIKESKIKDSIGALDGWGMLFLALTMGGIVFGLITAQTAGWENVLTLTYLVIGILSSILLFKIERHKTNPLIEFKDFSKLMFYAGAGLCFLAGVLSGVALFFDPLYLQVILKQSPEFSGLVLFAIPLAVFMVAFILGWLIHQWGIINTLIIGFLLAILSCFLQIFFTSTTPLWFIITAFICLGSLWAMGNTVPIIAAQTAVGTGRSSVATGTMVTMFNIGGSLGLAIAVVVYHAASMRQLKYIFATENTISGSDFTQLENLIGNAADALKFSMNSTINTLFTKIFMHGFSSVMWFLLITSTVLLLSVLIFKWVKKTI